MKRALLASMLALIVGGIMLLAGVAKLGFIADLLSTPTQIGYMNGLAITILVGLPAKILLRLLFRIKYVLITPWFNV